MTYSPNITPAMIADAFSDAETMAPTDYPMPEPLPSALSPVEPFAPELLPSSLVARCMDIADRMQCAPDFPAVGAMVALGSIIGRAVGIRPKRRDDWLVVPNLWGCIVGRPSALKSPALKDATLPLRKLEAEAGKTFKDAMDEHKISITMMEMDEKHAKRKAEDAIKKGKHDEAKAILSELVGDIEAPTVRRYQTNDATVEKLGELLSQNERGILMFRDELSGWLAGLEREGREGERSFYLEAFNGTGRFTYDRIGRGTVDIEACTVSVLGGTQPGKLSQYVRQAIRGGAGDDGLMQRFQLLVWPDKDDWTHVDRYPDLAAKQAAQDVFDRLANITGDDVGAETDKFEKIPFLHFDDAGQAVFDDWISALMPRTKTDDMPPYLEAHLAKYKSLMPSLALIVHLAEGGVGAVPESAAMRAAAWCEYLESHARRMYSPGLMGSEQAAFVLAKKLKAGELGSTFKVRELYRKGWEGLSRPEDAQAAIEVLEDHKWLVVDEVRQGTGRPSQVCTVNPRISEVTL